MKATFEERERLYAEREELIKLHGKRIKSTKTAWGKYENYDEIVDGWKKRMDILGKRKTLKTNVKKGWKIKFEKRFREGHGAKPHDDWPDFANREYILFAQEKLNSSSYTSTPSDNEDSDDSDQRLSSATSSSSNTNDYNRNTLRDDYEDFFAETITDEERVSFPDQWLDDFMFHAYLTMVHGVKHSLSDWHEIKQPMMVRRKLQPQSKFRAYENFKQQQVRRIRKLKAERGDPEAQRQVQLQREREARNREATDARIRADPERLEKKLEEDRLRKRKRDY